MHIRSVFTSKINLYFMRLQTNCRIDTLDTLKNLSLVNVTTTCNRLLQKFYLQVNIDFSKFGGPRKNFEIPGCSRYPKSKFFDSISVLS